MATLCALGMEECRLNRGYIGVSYIGVILG